MLIDIPDDLAWAVARALEHQASWYRQDKGHDPADVTTLERDADRLDALAAEIDKRLERIEADRRSASLEPACPSEHCPMCSGAACNLCGAGCWNNAAPFCEHAVDERHREPTCSASEE